MQVLSWLEDLVQSFACRGLHPSVHPRVSVVSKVRDTNSGRCLDSFHFRVAITIH